MISPFEAGGENVIRTIEDLASLVQRARWFERLGEPSASEAWIVIPSLKPWANAPTGNEHLEQVADLMTWLPSSRDQDDPVHGRTLEDLADQLGRRETGRRATMEIYKLALVSLRAFNGHSALKIGSQDFAEAARGAVLFASRRAGWEVLVGHPGFWRSVMALYEQGRWPCGLMPDRTLVVL